MKYELSVEYPRKDHPKLDALVEKNAGIKPYHTAVGSRVRTLEFAFESLDSYNKAHDNLVKVRGITVIGGYKNRS